MPNMTPHLTERSYEELRRQAEAHTGEVSNRRRIQQIECRYGGTDHLIRIGEAGAVSGGVVTAIFQLGRENFTIHHAQPHGAPETPVVISKKNVYSIAEFG